MGDRDWTGIFLLLLWTGLLWTHSNATPRVTKLEQHFGSLGGETRLTIQGSGFSANQFNYGTGNTHLGNTVTLVSSTQEFDCPVHKDGSHETQIMCYTSQNMKEDTYYVKVKVDGTTVTDANLCGGNPSGWNCQYTARSSYTPTINYMLPRSGTPGSLVEFRGKIFTDRYGSNLDSSTNERTAKLLRVYVGPLGCEVKDPSLDESENARAAFYKLTLDSTSSDWGNIKCKTTGTSLGYYNASYIVEAPFGRSLPDSDNFLVSSKDKVYMYQIFTEIGSLSHSSGSTEGGLRLTINGQHFDERPPYTPVKVFVGGTACVTEAVQDKYIICRVDADPSNTGSDFTGNRGLLFEKWDGTAIPNSDLDNILALTSSDSGYSSTPIDETYFTDSNADTYVTRTSGYFVPPHSGQYQFYLQADDRAKMFFSATTGAPADKVEIINSGSNVWSSKMSLIAGKPYYLQIIHREGSGSAYFDAGVKFYDTQFTRDYTGKADQEIQTIHITSTVVPEVQVLDFQSFSQRSETNEVQTVDVKTSGSFRLGLYGVFTGPLTIVDDDSTVGKALNSLPFLSSTEQFTVTATPYTDGTGSVYKITFQSKRGNIPNIKVREVAGNPPVTVNVSTNTDGRPDMETVSLSMEDVPSPLFTISDLTSTILAASLDTMFGTQCPKFILNPTNPAVFENYESEVGSSVGTRVKDEEAFCGRYTLKNPSNLYKKDSESKGILLANNKMLCFAYKGMISDSLRLGYSYEDPNSGDTVSGRYSFSQSYVRDSEKESTSWHYNCTDMMDLVQSRHPTISSYRLEYVTVYRQNADVDIFIDTVYIGPATTSDMEEINVRRLRPAMPNRAIIDTVSVSKTSGGTFEVTLTPFDCGYNFPLFGLTNGNWQSGNTRSSSATLVLKNGGSGSLSVQRTRSASPPVTGTIDVTFNSHTKSNINVSLKAEDLRQELQSIPGIGNLNVYRTDNCAIFDITVTMLSLPGDQPEMTVTKHLSGTDPDATVATNMNGGLWYKPIQGDMLRTHHTSPQVVAFINDVPTRCGNGSDCSFTWSSATTPTVTAVDVASGSQGTTLVITGTDFDGSTSRNNTVEIGGVNCVVTASTTTTVTCNVGNGPTGTYRINVEVDGMGLAKHPGGNISFTYGSGISSISPTSSGYGGTIITISGHGFNPDSVSVGSKDCYIISSSPSQVVCRAGTASADGQIDVVISQGETTLSYTGFTYSNSDTARISSISPSSLDIEGGTVTLSGNGFGASSVSSDALTIGGVATTITSYSNSQIVANIPAMVPGQPEVRLMTQNGYAVDASSGAIPSVSTDLSVTNVFPAQGSMYGGTRLTVTGSGFSTNVSKVEVTVGGHACDVESSTVSQIICLIADTATTHIVTNQGTHKDLGVGYAYLPSHLTIDTNDFVQWQWSTPEFINDIAHSVIQVDSPVSKTAVDGGFTSGNKTKSGSYKYRFTVPGTYYIWSDYVDLYGIMEYRGTVEVVAKTSSFGTVEVKVSGKTAIYNVGGTTNPRDSSSCQSTLSAITGCSDSLPTGSDATKFNFAFWSCLSPVVTTIGVDSGTTNTGIVISGRGFSGTNCRNEIKFGNDNCLAITSSSDSVTCSIDQSTKPMIGTRQDLTARVGNRGNALLALMKPLQRTFALVPTITGYTPTSGSTAGGTKLTITGTGFNEDASKVSVTIDLVSCDVTAATYTQIICNTPAFRASVKTVNVSVDVNGSPLPAKCEYATDPQCRFIYGSEWTPTITSILPTSVSSATTLTIAGQDLGLSTSGVEVTIGGTPCTVNSANDVDLTCSIANLPAGSNNVVVNVLRYGHAAGSLTVTGVAEITTNSPSTGSVHGGTLLSINGNGFVNGSTTVTIDGTTCMLQSVTLYQVVCVVPAHVAGSVSVAVTSNGQSYNVSQSYTYDTTSTPTVSSISPTDGQQGDTLTITGQNFANSGTTIIVTLDGVACTVTSQNPTQIQCRVGAHATGSTPVSVYVEGKGNSNTDVNFNYELTMSSISPASGSTFGGQVVTVSGTGFDTVATTVLICGQACVMDTSAAQSSTQYICRTPGGTGSCDVAISANGLSGSMPGAYTYDANLTPEITGVSPTRGGTGGGVTLTVTGTGFGTNKDATSVKIDGSVCSVISVTNTQITCQTGNHTGSITAPVEVEISSNGLAQQTSADFTYIDVWSSPYTWGGLSPPIAGDFVIIPKGMKILLDNNTEVLKILLIQGGELIFDEKNIELKAEIILVTDGGKLQIGTESAPFPAQYQATITLYGHHRSKELPIYGTKVLAIREGTLDLHGSPVAFTWTRLASTATAGSNQVTLTHPVDWSVGDEVVVASTGHRHTQRENEQHTISAISVDKLTLTFTNNLAYSHTGTSEVFDGTTVELRGEVGLLTRNVKIQGDQDPQWEDKIEACKAGFNTGEFATQTCFLGRFGEEIGSTGFGAQVIIHNPEKDTHKALARISYVEVFFAGQEFRLGRYPLHFHLNGDMSTSYIRGCAIHKTFNRAINIHGVHNTLVEWNVVYDIRGGAIFLEDGIEHGNTFQYNLGVFVRESSSLLNDDITPATFWCTNPNNTYEHNAAAGGTHFGWWYRMHSHPEGPSATKDVCPDKIPLKIFYNNTAHSFGWFGFWMFTNYFPMKDDCTATEVEPAVFRKFLAWNCDKGAETVNGGSLQFEDFTLVQNRLAGYEGKLVINVPQYTDASPMVKNSLIVGHTSGIRDSHQGCTGGGIAFPYGNGFRVKDVRFVNFDESGCAAFRWTRIDGTCGVDCGGYNYHVEGLKFVNSENKAIYAWEYEGIIVDKDGTASGKTDVAWAGGKILPKTAINPSDCEDIGTYSKGIEASLCPANYKFHRFAFNDIRPASLEGKRVMVENSYGTSYGRFQGKRLTHKPGWMLALVGGETYKFSFENGEQFKNVSYNGAFYDFQGGDYLFMKMKLAELPDRFSIDGGKTYINGSATPIDPIAARTGDWYWDNTDNSIQYIIHGTARSKRGSPTIGTYGIDRGFSFTTFKCYYTDCIPPPDPDKVPPEATRPLAYQFWSNPGLWQVNNATGYVENSAVGNGTYGTPKDGDNVEIVVDQWMLVDIDFPQLGTLMLYGVLELDNRMDNSTGQYKQFTLRANFIIIYGGRLIIGWPNDPFMGLASIILSGTHSTREFPRTSGPPIGAKVIGVFGGLDLFGKDVGVTWTKLSTTANAGTNQIVLRSNVTWQVGDEIVIAPTGYNAWHTETFRITAVSADGFTLTLNDTLKYTHISHTETLSTAAQIDMVAEVGLLTRNIKIIGEDYGDLWKDGFGARILVSTTEIRGSTYTGYARLNNVEFYHTGQDGYTENYDARYSVTYMGVPVNSIKPSQVSNCAFHHGFSTAIGLYGANNMTVENNVIHHAVGNAFVTESAGTRFNGNLIVLLVWTGAYLDRKEPQNFRYEAGVEGMLANDFTMENNVVAGSERVGYHVQGQDCSTSQALYTNNVAHSNLMGMAVLPADELPFSCVKVTGYSAWKNHDYGLYYQSAPNVEFEDNTLIENGVGIYPMVLGPGATGHAYANKTVTVKNVRLVGSTTSFDCTNDILPSGDTNIDLSGTSRPPKSGSGGRLGLLMPQFASGSNKCPEKPCAGAMAYPAIMGLMKVSDVTLAHFGTRCNNIRDVAFATNPGNDDGQHPMEFSSITTQNVDIDSRFFIHRPNVRKINGADCVDMDCDGLKKALFKDMDGSLLGSPGAVISQSEYEWNGDPRRGLGDYRIPKVMLTELDGTRIPVNDIAPNKGIIRNTNCTYQSTWKAWQCHNLDYLMLIIESLDNDTETRRISPVAISGDGYLDLINGPQDHGWCSGYTWKHFDLFLTSTTPQNMRYLLLNSDSSQVVSLAMWYSQSNRLDVFYDDVYVPPTNLKPNTGSKYILLRPNGNEYKPHVDNSSGTNFLDRDYQMLYFIVKGPKPVKIITNPVIVVSFNMPAVTVDEFYGDNMVQILAAFLNIPVTKIRVVNVVSAASSSAGRRKRSSSGVNVQFEIGNEPTTGINDTTSNEIPYSELTKLGADVLVLCQLSNTTEVFGNTTTCQTIAYPPPNPGTDEWANIGTGNPAVSIVVPDQLSFQTSLVTKYEGTFFSTQPKLNVLDVGGQMITMLGTTGYEWQLTVSIRAGTGHPDAVLSGNTTVTLNNGWANFTDLAISHMGTGYILDFNVTYPSEAENFTLATSPFDVAGRPVKGNVKSVSTDIVKDNMFVVVLELRDGETDEVLPNIAWRNHTWTAKADLIDFSDYGTLTGTKQTTFDPSTGEARFSSLQISALGPYYVQIRVESNPAGYNFTLNQKVDIHSAAHLSMTIENTSELKMSFPVDFNKILPDDDTKAKFEQKVVQKFVNDYPDIKITNSALSEGSIVVTFTVSGSNTSVNSTIYNMCDNLTTSYTFSFSGYSLGLSGYMTVNGVSYYGSVCGEITSDTSNNDDDSLHPGIIAAICISAVLLLIGIAALVAWKCKVYPKTKTHDVPPKVQYFGPTNEPIESILFQEKTFNSIKGDVGGNPAPPAYHNYAMLLDPKDNYMRPRSGGVSPLPVKQGLPPVYDALESPIPPKIRWPDGTSSSINDDQESRSTIVSSVGIGGESPQPPNITWPDGTSSPIPQAELFRANSPNGSSRERLFARSPSPALVQRAEPPLTMNNIDED